MIQKEIYGAIEFIDHEVRFVLGEFHNNQLNILKTESLYTNAIEKISIVDMKMLVDNVKSIIDKVSSQMGFKINKVILLIPSYNLKRYSKRIKMLNNKKEKFSIEEVKETVNKSLNLELSSDEVLINKVINRYTVDGIKQSKLKLDKDISELFIDVDIYTGDKNLIFDYLSVIELAGLQVLDIYSDSYALAKEMALLNDSRDKNIIVLKYERCNLTMSFLNKGRIISSVMVDVGYADLVSKIQQSNNISEKNAEKLILTNNFLAIADKQKAPVFIYSEGSETKSIDDNYLNNLLLPILSQQFTRISEMIKPIVKENSTQIYITGKGASIVALSDVCQNILQCKTKVYIPEILGARKGSLVTCLGGIYAYKDTSIFSDKKENSVDVEEFVNEVKIKEEEKKKIESHSEDSMANRFKELFKLSKDN